MKSDSFSIVRNDQNFKQLLHTQCVIEQKKTSEGLHLLWKHWDTHLIPFTVISWSSQPVTAQGRLLPTWPSEHAAEPQAFWD